MSYRAPIGDLLRTMRLAAEGRCPELEDGTAASVLEGATAFAESVLGPLCTVGDREGVRLTDTGVRTPSGWAEAYRDWIAGGWNGVSAPENEGGLGLPLLIHFACAEIWSGANLAFALAPILNSGAVEALHHHASPALKARLLPKLVSGEWTGTMNLTEPQAGSDLSGLATRAAQRSDGTYAITGQKIFISYGDHDLSDNIVHLVLARLPDAPAGTRGISLFAVPKRLVDPEGRLGEANDLRCIGVERKLGMHAAPTCTMAFGENGGATGFLIGEENRGLACMFTMMNNARLAVGIEGVAAAERATQTALAYARERRQGRRADGTPAAIVDHPDVARMLMTMRTSTAAARAICFMTAHALDMTRRASDPDARRAASDRAALLTPIAKALSTDLANEVASLGVQVHGGLGFVEDTGAAQILRDARILAIYEGTNGIQAVDLVTRKLPMDEGGVVAREIDALRRIAEEARSLNRPGLREAVDELSTAIDTLATASRELRRALAESPPAALGVATPYLRLFGLTLGAAALVAMAAQAEESDAMRLSAEACFFAQNILPDAIGLGRVVERGGAALSTAPRAWSEALLAGTA